MPSLPGETSLTPDERRSWRAYVELHEAGRRSEALAELDAFLEALAAAGRERRDTFADSLAGAWLDPLEPSDRPPTLVRYPLVRDVLFPYLLARLASPAGARRMAILLLSGVVAPREWQQLPEGRSPTALLQRVAAEDSGDTQARKWLLDRVLRSLGYAFHELPAGVLADPEELESDAQWLERLAPEFGRERELAPLVAYTREQAAVVRDFRRRTDRSTSYELFMASRGIDWRKAPVA
jgi:hypothetical protein